MCAKSVLVLLGDGGNYVRVPLTKQAIFQASKTNSEHDLIVGYDATNYNTSPTDIVIFT